MSRLSNRRASVSPYPRPRDLELREDYIARFMEDEQVQASYRAPVKARIAAEREWARAKAQSMVSVTTSFGESLMFGDPTRRPDWR